jgi:hypothetical protein
MAEREISKLDIAGEYLDASIEFFLSQTNFFCAIHLAAAAEELLGAHLPEDQRIAALAWKAERAFKTETGRTPSNKEVSQSVNEWKNEIKHMSDGTSRTVTIDSAFATRHHIDHALINLHKLGLQRSAAIWKLEDYENSEVAPISRLS